MNQNGYQKHNRKSHYPYTNIPNIIFYPITHLPLAFIGIATDNADMAQSCLTVSSMM